MAISKDILDREVNARFWALGFKPGQKLDPKNPTDRAMMPVWKDIFRKVAAEANAGKLITTYDHPAVAQALTDAEVASKVAAAYLEGAATATDPATAQQHIAAATTALQVAAQKSREAAANQPPTVSPQIQQDAAKEAAKNPPPPHASPSDHVAHAQSQTPPTPTVPREVLFKETNERFWNATNYKRGQRLDMSNPQDAEMAKRWRQIFHEVEREAAEGRLMLTPPQQPTPPAPQPPAPPPPAPQYPMMPPWMRPGQMQQPRPGQMPPWMPWMPGMHMHPGMRQPGMQQPGMQQPGGAAPAPSTTPSTPESAATTPSTDSTSTTPSTQPSTPSSTAEAPPPADSSWGIGTYFLIAAGVVVGGTALYYGVKHYSSSSKPSPRPRAVTPKVILATATPARPARSARPALPGLPPARAVRS